MDAKIGWMLTAKASDEDLQCADQLTFTMEAIAGGYFPDEICVDEIGEAFDAENPADCQRVVRHLLDIASKGSIGRAVLGLRTVFDPRNAVLAPDSDVLELHPRLSQGLDAVAELKASGWARLTDMGQVKPWDHLTFKRPGSERRSCALVSHVENPGTDAEQIRFEIAHGGSSVIATSAYLSAASSFVDVFVLSAEPAGPTS